MTVAFIGHRKIKVDNSLRDRLTQIVEHLINDNNAEIFLLGNNSEFDNLCYEVLTNLKLKYKFIQRVLVRAKYEYIDEAYTEYILTMYEKTFFPKKVHGAGILSYIKRNQVMIDMCEVLVTYCNKDYKPRTKTKSGTIMAVDYAIRKNKRVINSFSKSQD